MLPFCDQDQQALRERVRAWSQSYLFDAGPAKIEQKARQLVRRLGKEKFLNHVIPESYGGARARVQARELCILREELARGDALADTMLAVQALGSYPLIVAGSERQKQSYLPGIAQGGSIAAFALTEPESGSDVASLASMATRDGRAYRLCGVKRFISNAGIADHYVVFAAVGSGPRGKGISAFIVDAGNPGLRVTERMHLLSPHPVGVVTLEDCVVPDTALIGAEGQGLAIAFATLDFLRCSVGAAAVGLAQRALEGAVVYSRKRRQFGRTLGEFQGTEFKLAEMATDLEAARTLVYQAAWAHDCGADAAKQRSSMAKLFATEAAQRIVDQALQIHGGNGLVAGSMTERLYRDVRALRIYEGTSEIQKVIIARELLKATGNRL